MEAYRTRTLTESYWPAADIGGFRAWTLGHLLADTAARAPERLALVAGTRDPAKRRTWTYRQLERDAHRVAGALLGRYRPGDRIAMWASNIPEWVLMLYGSALAGMTLVTINPAFRQRELEYVLERAEVSALFVMDTYRGFEMHAAATSAAEKLNVPPDVFRIADFESFMESGDKDTALPTVSPDSPAMIMFTSGTTGAQKGIVLHHVGLVNMATFAQARGGLADGGVNVNIMPMFHLGAMGVGGIGSVAHRATHLLAEEWDPEFYMQLVQEFGGTYSILVPTMIEALLTHPRRAEYDISTLRNLVAGAAKVEARTVRRAASEMNCQIVILFGQTEMHGVISGVHMDDAVDDKTDTLGQPMPLIEVKIADIETGEILPIGEIGEICIRGYQQMIGYYKMPDETAKVMRPNGWIHSGDLGTMDARGFLRITGRLKEMIIRGGENIFPAEIEELLREFPGVGDVAVVGVPDPHWGEQVGAVVIPSGEARPDPDEMRAFCRKNIAAHKAPSLWFFADGFPLTETGKVQKFKLRQMIDAGSLNAAPLKQAQRPV
ncbi:MAG: AMP-binding protein [Rhodobiaceae bacterium]|nr:AMP-binding protein [Rhodobiaceae bacterium]MCC0057100.1 AMP-binding protein [Rhodobiaceae bacterium]